MKTIQNKIVYIIILSCVSFAFVSGFLVNRYLTIGRPKFTILDQAFEILEKHALYSLPESPSLEYGMIQGMVRAFNDPYTVFLEPVHHELEYDSLQGSFGGIGVSMSQNSEGYVILFPLPDSAAAKVGIFDGDRLVSVEDLLVLPETSLETVQAAIRGPEGSNVTLTIARPPEDKHLEFVIKREEILLPSVSWHLDTTEPRLGIIEVNLIAASTPDEILTAVADMQSKGASCFALDLRNNNGGLVSAGVEVARLFLEEGLVIKQQYRDQEVEDYYVEKPGPLKDLPLVVLVDEGTASAAEIIAGSLKIRERTQIIGIPTFGKDTIQLIFELDDGSSLHVTNAKWWIPGLEPPLGENGIIPDVLISIEERTNDPFLEAAIQASFDQP